MYQLEPNNFTLFVNKHRSNDKQPNYTGDAALVCESCGGVSHMRLAGWKRNSKKVGDYISGKLSKPQTKDDMQQDANANTDFDDDIPF